MKNHITKCAMILIVTLCNTGNAIHAQSEDSLSTPHKGLQISIYCGGAFGNITDDVYQSADMIMRGAPISFFAHAGYAFNNWAVGIVAGFNSMEVRTISYYGEDSEPEYAIGVDNSLNGIYVTRYFMPMNLYVTTELGFGKFSMWDDSGEVFYETDNGLAWNVRAGKEFIFGKRQNFGFGAYASLGGLQLHDNAPFENDVISYLGPGFGVSISYH